MVILPDGYELLGVQQLHVYIIIWQAYGQWQISLYGMLILTIISFTHYKANPTAAIIYLSSIGGTRLKKVGQVESPNHLICKTHNWTTSLRDPGGAANWKLHRFFIEAQAGREPAEPLATVRQCIRRLEALDFLNPKYLRVGHLATHGCNWKIHKWFCFWDFCSMTVLFSDFA